MKVYKTTSGIVIDHLDAFYRIEDDWDSFINNDKVLSDTARRIGSLKPDPRLKTILDKDILPPIGSQEVWAAGVTYYRSKVGRQEESKNSGGGDFYARVYEAERPEIFFKNTAGRVSGHNQTVRIRKDSTWNVPEPELTLMVTSNGKIVGYTIGNDMSSRSIEGENPLYLPQAKSYDKSASIGPCIYLTDKPLSPETMISITIDRKEKVFEGSVAVSQIKRSFNELVEFLFRETSFPSGCLFMTGTGVVPGNDFTLHRGDKVSITIDTIGTLVNHVD
jgi:2-dehydro-3-deoxy-D-arabinonate dehydratase